MQTAIMLSHSYLFTWLPCLDCSPAHVWFPTKCSGSVPRACLPTRWIEGMFKQCLWPQLLGGATHHLEPGGGSSRCFSGGQDWSGWWWQIQRAEPEIFPPAGGGQHKPGLHFKHLRTQTHTWELSLLQDTLPLLAQLGSGRALQSGLRIAVKRRTQNIRKFYSWSALPCPIQLQPLKREEGASMVAQQKRVCLQMQETQVWSLNWEDPTCCGATKPTHNYRACALESRSHNYSAYMLQLLKSSQEQESSQEQATIMRSLQTATRESSHCSPQLKKSLLGSKDSAMPNKTIHL